MPRRVMCVLAVLAFASVARAQTDDLPFDPARIGLPALTKEGIDLLIAKHEELIEEARNNIKELEKSTLSNKAEVISRYNQSIRDELEQIARLAGQRATELKDIAKAGQVKDLPALRQLLTTVLHAAQFNALSGLEKLATEEYQAAVEALMTFSATFKTACYDQEFDPRIAIGLERQNQLLGTGIDVTPCAYRRFTAEGSLGPVVWTFSHCGLGVGEWTIKTGGAFVGGGKGTIRGDDLSGTWTVDETGPVRVVYVGDWRIIPSPEPPPGSTKQPNQLSLHVASGTVYGTGGPAAVDLSMHPARMLFVIKPSDKPCHQEEEK